MCNDTLFVRDFHTIFMSLSATAQGCSLWWTDGSSPTDGSQVLLPQSRVPAQDFHGAPADLCRTMGTHDPSSESDPRRSRPDYIWKSGSAIGRSAWHGNLPL